MSIITLLKLLLKNLPMHIIHLKSSGTIKLNQSFKSILKKNKSSICLLTHTKSNSWLNSGPSNVKFMKYDA